GDGDCVPSCGREQLEHLAAIRVQHRIRADGTIPDAVHVEYLAYRFRLRQGKMRTHQQHKAGRDHGPYPGEPSLRSDSRVGHLESSSYCLLAYLAIRLHYVCTTHDTIMAATGGLTFAQTAGVRSKDRV